MPTFQTSTLDVSHIFFSFILCHISRSDSALNISMATVLTKRIEQPCWIYNRQKPTQLMLRSDDWCNYFIEQQHTKVVTDWSRTACDPLAWILHLTSISSKITKLQYSWYTIDSKLLQYVICINNLTNQNWTMTSNVLNLKFNEIVMYRMVRVTDLYLYWVEASVKSGSQTRPYVGWLTLQNTSQTTMPHNSHKHSSGLTFLMLCIQKLSPMIFFKIKNTYQKKIPTTLHAYKKYAKVVFLWFW